MSCVSGRLPPTASTSRCAAATGACLSCLDPREGACLPLTAHTRWGRRFPCTAVAIRGDSVVAAFADGRVRIFSAGDGALLSEAAAHGRCITALTLHPTEHLFATVGEDTLVNVWTLPNPQEKGPSLELVASRRRPDMQLAGVAFSRMGSNLVASAYDWPALHVWKRS